VCGLLRLWRFAEKVKFMPYAGGYAGSILHVNLSSGGVRKEPLDTQLAKTSSAASELTCGSLMI